MKTAIHPTWNNDVTVTCSCGNTFTTGSSFTSIQVDICSACHPFFTGEMKFVDVQGRVEKFQAKQKAAAQRQAQNKKKSTTTKTVEEPKSLKEMLTAVKDQTKDKASSDTPIKH